jgi:uncharacterized protein (DUF305 family)
MRRLQVLALVLAAAACGGGRGAAPGRENPPGAGPDYDVRFLDAMIEHHRGALAMASQALDSASHAELDTLAAAIIASQTAQIDSMSAWRTALGPDGDTTADPGMDMGAMSVLPGSDPWDVRFLDAMISHHLAAVGMAETALDSSDDARVRLLAGEIIEQQNAEVSRMEGWRTAWLRQP